MHSSVTSLHSTSTHYTECNGSVLHALQWAVCRCAATPKAGLPVCTGLHVVAWDRVLLCVAMMALLCCKCVGLQALPNCSIAEEEQQTAGGDDEEEPQEAPSPAKAGGPFGRTQAIKAKVTGV